MLNEIDDPQGYFATVTETWIDSLVAKFPSEIWNQYATIEEAHTNNHLEGWNSALNRQLGHLHPNIFVLVKLLRSEQQKMEQQLQLLRSGDAPPQQQAAHKE